MSTVVGTVSKRDAYLRRTYDMTEAQWNKMLRAQRGGCAICGRKPKPGRRLNTDHDHRTGRVRGALCFHCNYRLLGRGRENADNHERAAAYLRSEVDWRRV